MSDENLVWIRTQDGSPTLWNNEVGESYRSAKGAFSESLTVFIKPALEFVRQNPRGSFCVGEFGLGAGTNWLFWNLASYCEDIAFDYFAIERDTTAFEKALVLWKEDWEQILASFDHHTGLLKKLSAQAKEAPTFTNLKAPEIFSSLEDALMAHKKAQIWFHDPFGFSVNPDGYSPETLSLCQQLWDKTFIGTSYACNGQFQRNLKSCGVQTIKTYSTIAASLKKESLVFSND